MLSVTDLKKKSYRTAGASDNFTHRPLHDNLIIVHVIYHSGLSPADKTCQCWTGLSSEEKSFLPVWPLTSLCMNMSHSKSWDRGNLYNPLFKSLIPNMSNPITWLTCHVRGGWHNQMLFKKFTFFSGASFVCYKSILFLFDRSTGSYITLQCLVFELPQECSSDLMIQHAETHLSGNLTFSIYWNFTFEWSVVRTNIFLTFKTADCILEVYVYTPERSQRSPLFGTQEHPVWKYSHALITDKEHGNPLYFFTLICWW